MEKKNVNNYLIANKELFPGEKLAYIKKALEGAPNDSYDNLNIINFYNPSTVLVFSILLGGLGIDRFMIGDTGLGICKLFFGFITFGIWPIIDIFFSYKKAKEKNLQKLLSSI